MSWCVAASCPAVGAAQTRDGFSATQHGGESELRCFGFEIMMRLHGMARESLRQANLFVLGAMGARNGSSEASPASALARPNDVSPSGTWLRAEKGVSLALVLPLLLPLIERDGVGEV